MVLCQTKAWYLPWQNTNCVGTGAGVSGEVRCKSREWEDQLG